MKTLSLKLDDAIFMDTESITSELKLPRNRYINDAVKMYNLYNRRRLLRKQLEKESGIVREESMEIVREFEKLWDGDQSI